MSATDQLPQSGESGSSVCSSTHRIMPSSKAISAIRLPWSRFSRPVQQLGVFMTGISPWRGGEGVTEGAAGAPRKAGISAKQKNVATALICDRKSLEAYAFRRIATIDGNPHCSFAVDAHKFTPKNPSAICESLEFVVPAETLRNFWRQLRDRSRQFWRQLRGGECLALRHDKPWRQFRSQTREREKDNRQGDQFLHVQLIAQNFIASN